MPDPILTKFLRKSYAAALELAAASDRFALFPENKEVPQRYLVEFYCKGLVRLTSGEVTVAEQFSVEVWFPDDYRKTRQPSTRILTWRSPAEGIFHPNVRMPVICAGTLPMSTDLSTIILTLYEMITYQRFSTADPLDPVAAEFARANMARFPLDSRPLRRRKVNIEVLSGATP